MREAYEDIRGLTEKQPEWWDENGVPRYCAPRPESCPNIYADTVGFFDIECQGCGARFLVQMCSSHWDGNSQRDPVRWEYGDPPNACCLSGATMSSIPRVLVALWQRNCETFDWENTRRSVPIDCAWADA